MIGKEKEKLGSMRLDDALARALKDKCDLLLVSPDQKPPVARIIKWSRYKFELEQDAKEKKKGSKT